MLLEEAFDNKLTEEEISFLCNEIQFNLEENLQQYQGTSINQANLLLKQILNRDEKLLLERVYFDNEQGWYKQINGDGAIRLKLAAMILRSSNKIFCFDPIKENEIREKIITYSEEEQNLLIRSYFKQKVVTYVTLKNYMKKVIKSEQDYLTLYRGINVEYCGQNYKCVGLESWTLSEDVAYSFARSNGFIIKRNVPINKIFAGRRSTYKNKAHRMYRNNGFYVRREHEMIVENYDEIIECKLGENVFHSIDKSIF